MDEGQHWGWGAAAVVFHLWHFPLPVPSLARVEGPESQFWVGSKEWFVAAPQPGTE